MAAGDAESGLAASAWMEVAGGMCADITAAAAVFLVAGYLGLLRALQTWALPVRCTQQPPVISSHLTALNPRFRHPRRVSPSAMKTSLLV